ncbi:MAG: hypothetical protein JW781_09290 [Deltaproteobacteria bacterium]|nr:hypothetical protein [Candidatus Anaeroferrophillacea bacterium]
MAACRRLVKKTTGAVKSYALLGDEETPALLRAGHDGSWRECRRFFCGR